MKLDTVAREERRTRLAALPTAGVRAQPSGRPAARRRRHGQDAGAAAEGEVVHGASIICARARGASPVLDRPEQAPVQGGHAHLPHEEAHRAGMRRGFADAAERATERELTAQEWTRGTADFKEGVKAWGERRLPNFEGR